MLIKEFRPDLVVLDVMLPDINGNEVCSLVRSDKTMDDVRIICISGMVEQDKIQELRDAGADDFMKKPFDVDQLVDRVCQLLDVGNASRRSEALVSGQPVEVCRTDPTGLLAV